MDGISVCLHNNNMNIQPETVREKQDTYKPVYPHGDAYARGHGELDIYRESNRLNCECVKVIDESIRDNNYELYRYDMESALESVTAVYGSDRVDWVLANTLQHYDYDGRFSRENKEWAKGFDIPPKEYNDFLVTTHPAVLNGFINQVRKVHEMEKTAPAVHPAPDVVQGYMVLQYVFFDNDRGFALAENPTAPQPFVTWQFAEEDGKRDYYWGHYTSSEEKAKQGFTERVSVYEADYSVREKYNYLVSAEISKEQNYNMIDGLCNNEAPARADLTDGQTYEEICELAPETLPVEKASVVGRIRAARQDSHKLKEKEPTVLKKDKGGHEL